jgi:hypothetical protein
VLVAGKSFLTTHSSCAGVFPRSMGFPVGDPEIVFKFRHPDEHFLDLAHPPTRQTPLLMPCTHGEADDEGVA